MVCSYPWKSYDEPGKNDRKDEAAVDAVLAEFSGGHRAVIKALLHDIDLLARDFNGTVSRGFVRGEKRVVKTSMALRPR